MAKMMNATSFTEGYQAMAVPESINTGVYYRQPTKARKVSSDFFNDLPILDLPILDLPILDLPILDLRDEKIKQSGANALKVVKCRGRGTVSYNDDFKEIVKGFEKEAMKPRVQFQLVPRKREGLWASKWAPDSFSSKDDYTKIVTGFEKEAIKPQAQFQLVPKERKGLWASKWAPVANAEESRQSEYQDAFGASNQTPRVYNENERWEDLISRQEANSHTLPKIQEQIVDDKLSFGFRALYIEDFPDDITVHEIHSHIRGGKIEYTLTYFDQPKRAAMIVFLRPSDASEFYEYVEQHPITIRGQLISVRYSQKTSAHNISAQDMYYHKIFDAKGATRRLVIQNIPSWVTAEKLREDVQPSYKTTKKGNREHEWLECISLDAQGCAEVEFCSIRNAIAAADTLAKMDEYTHAEIAFGRDRCEDLLGSQGTDRNGE
ncbi:hypothetical protein RUND412_008695 [Rhizina undulata]